MVVHSTVTRKNAIFMWSLVVFFSALLVFDLYAWFVKGFFHATEVAFGLIILLVLFSRMSAKYTYELGRKSIIFTKRDVFGRKIIHEVPYKNVFGVYLYKTKLVGYIKFRRTFRFNSALDGNDVWVLAYEVQSSNAKKENHRVYFKPTPEMLTELDKKVNGKVHGSEETTVTAKLREEMQEEADKKSEQKKE